MPCPRAAPCGSPCAARTSRAPTRIAGVGSSNSARQVLDYLTVTGVDNITRPSLVEKWEPSPDLKTWTLRLRKTVRKWHNGRQFTADDVVWNLKRVLDPKTGSSVVGLMKGLSPRGRRDGREGRQGDTRSLPASGTPAPSQKIDDFTVRLNGKVGAARGARAALPLPLLIVDPAENGEFKVGSNGTGAFTLTANEVGRKQRVLKARKEGYLGRRAAPRPARVHRPRRRPRRLGERARLQAGGRALRHRHRPAPRRSRRSRTCRCTRWPRPTRRRRGCSR